MTHADKRLIPQHFSTIATKYNELRITDPEVVDAMAGMLAGLPSVTAADVGCGTGRYMLELMTRLGHKIFTYFVDTSRPMLEQLRAELDLRGFSRFHIVAAQAERLPIPHGVLDCMLVLNAIHHFDPGRFLQEARRTLRPGGRLFIYTRFRDQNARGIWGRYFPGFTQKEKRLFEQGQLTSVLGSMPDLVLSDITHFSFRRAAALPRLIERVRGRHYSTFCLYGPDELERAIQGFELNLKEQFGVSEMVEWVDENVLVTVERV